MKAFSSIKRFVLRILPAYAFVPAILAVSCNFIAYYIPKVVLRDAVHYDLSIFIDDLIPFLPWFIFFYILAYGQWASNYIYHAHAGREIFYHMATAVIIAKMVSMVFFLVLPTEIVRPEVTGGGLWNELTRMIYAADTPRNLFPSLHCVESWAVYRMARKMKSAPRWYAPLQLFLSVMVFASTVFVKQHFFIDIFAGILAVELGWFLSRRFRLWRIFEWIELPCVRRARELPSAKDAEARKGSL